MYETDVPFLICNFNNHKLTLYYDVWKETKLKIIFLLKEKADDFVNIAN